MEFSLENTDVSLAKVQVQFNSDTTTNYQYRWHGVDNQGANTAGEADSASGVRIATISTDSPYATGTAKLYLKSARPRSILSEKTGENIHLFYSSTWSNTADEVTSIRIFTDYDMTGYIRIYKWSKG